MPTQQQSPALLATDRSASVIRRIQGASRTPIAYSPFGFHIGNPARTLIGFNGQLYDPLTNGYLLGNGYRAFNVVLQRFNNPDSASPFGAGGVNSYAYCAGDPVNFSDPSGHIPKVFKPLLRRLKIIRPSDPTPIITNRLVIRSGDGLDATTNRMTRAVTQAPSPGTVDLEIPAQRRLNLFPSDEEIPSVGDILSGRTRTPGYNAPTRRAANQVTAPVSRSSRGLDRVNSAPNLPPTYNAVFSLDLPPPKYSLSMENLRKKT